MNKLNHVPSPARTGHALSFGDSLPPLVRLTLSFALLVSANSSCSSNHNEDERKRFAASQADNDDSHFCVNEQTCTPDPGPKHMSQTTCERAEEDLEFHYIWRFDQGPAEKEVINPDGTTRRANVRFARELYSYDDETTYKRFHIGWEPPTETIDRCGAEDYALHTWGGPFLAWGGGFGGRVDWIYNQYCANADDPPDFCPTDAEDFPVVFDVNNGSDREVTWLDLTEWEGISFWARRGPDSQGGIRLAVADSNTDEDDNFARYADDPEAPRTCERSKICGCRNHKPCMKYEGEVSVSSTIILGPDDEDGDGLPDTTNDYYFCYDPDAGDPEPVSVQTDAKWLVAYTDEGEEIRYPWCGPSICGSLVESFQAVDEQFHGKPCTEFTLRTGLTDSYCYDPETDPEPVDTSALCGDMWLKGVTLSTDWEFFKVPFTQLLQQGWAKEFHEIRLDQVSTIRFTYDRGYIDYWIDDVAFYRVTRD